MSSPRCVVVALSLAVVLGASLVFACGYQDDFHVYLAGAHNFFSPALYTRMTRGEYFTYPPLAALLLIPFDSIGSATTAQVLWTTANVVSLVVLLASSLGAARPALAPRSRWLWAACLALPAFLLDPVLTAVRNGQVDLILTALVIWDLSRPGGAYRRLPMGVGTGIAAAIKLTPLIFVPYLVLTRRFRAAVACLATFLACEVVAFVASPRASRAYWTSDVFHFVRIGGYLGLRGLLATTDQSLFASLGRFDDGAVPSDLHWALTGFVALFGLLLSARVHSRWSPFAGIVVCAMTGLLVSPVTWTHHMVWVVPAIAWMAFSHERPRWGQMMAAATTVLFWAAPIWWFPNQLGVTRRIIGEAFIQAWSSGALTKSALELLAGNSFFLWMLLFLLLVAASTREVAAMSQITAPASGPTPGRSQMGVEFAAGIRRRVTKSASAVLNR
jgi:alpha-1,2-mannosyltransferase